MGIYPLTFAHLMLGPADRIAARRPSATRASTSTSRWPARHGAARLRAHRVDDVGLAAHRDRSRPTTGRIDLPQGFHSPAYATWRPADGEPERIDGVEPLIGTGLGNEAAHVQDCLHAGRLESPLVPHHQTLTLIRQMDEVRRQIGVSYASDRRCPAVTRRCGSPCPSGFLLAPIEGVVGGVEVVLGPLDRARHGSAGGRA